MEAWANSEDLSKENRETLEREVLEFYNNFRKTFETGDVATYESLMANAAFQMYQANYYSSEEASNKTATWHSFVSKKKTFDPINNYEMKFFADGKLVSLRGVRHGADLGEGVLRYKYQKGGDNRALTFDLFLHRATPTSKLEIIRYFQLYKNFFKGVVK